MLEKCPQAQLIVVGSGEPDDWKAAKARVGGRITGLSEVPDPKRYFEAADIYVDSYPFVSSTSMMEAAGYGLPAVTIFTLPDAARIFGINHVGLVGTSLVARSADAYDTMLERLVVDEAFAQRRAKRRVRRSSGSRSAGMVLQPRGRARARQDAPRAREQCRQRSWNARILVRLMTSIRRSSERDRTCGKSR